MLNNQEFFKKFTGLYSLSKTLRFELIPQGNTLQNIHNNNLLRKDKNRSENYKKMKKTLDEYHRYFIENAFKEVKLTKLKEYKELYLASAEFKKTKKYKEDFDKIKSELRKEVANCFKSDGVKETFNILDKKDLIKQELEEWKKREGKECFFDPDFKTFTTYFKGYNINRMNMYSADEKSTAISYRIVNENLPKFIDNIRIFELICKTDISKEFDELYKNLNSILDTDSISNVFQLEYFNNTLTQSQIDIYNTVIGGKKDDSIKIQGLNEYINLYNQKQKDKKLKLPKLKRLYKQILSPSSNISCVCQLKFDPLANEFLTPQC
jgi:CRISPR-associated protein Cpf1